jgi:hypothetical protein
MSDKKVLFEGSAQLTLKIVDDENSGQMSDDLGLSEKDYEAFVMRCATETWAVPDETTFTQTFARLMSQGYFTAEELGYLVVFGFKYMSQ